MMDPFQPNEKWRWGRVVNGKLRSVDIIYVDESPDDDAICQVFGLPMNSGVEKIDKESMTRALKARAIARLPELYQILKGLVSFASTKNFPERWQQIDHFMRRAYELIEEVECENIGTIKKALGEKNPNTTSDTNS